LNFALAQMRDELAIVAEPVERGGRQPIRRPP
jgi:hypothetical protein